MTAPDQLAELLEAASVTPAVFALRPDYRVLLLAVDGITPGPSDEQSDQLLAQAQAAARASLSECTVEQLPHIAAWRAAYQAFGAKPQRTRNSAEALLRRAESGLPRINRLTDIYNALSVLHQVPLGGEDLDHYLGAPRLTRATGEEPFETTAGGEPVLEHPEPGEVVWCDDAGVTCRRWNWRQTQRTQLTEHTTRALFVIDALEPVTDAEMIAIADELVAELTRFSPQLRSARRLIAAG